VNVEKPQEKIVTGASRSTTASSATRAVRPHPEEHYRETVGRFEATGKVVSPRDELRQQLRDVVFPGGA
jgi:hypothetical protein